MSVLTYKGYQAKVTYEDDRLVVQVLHIDDFLTTECTSATGVKESFHDLIDDYLAECESLGREPNKPFKGSFNVRMSPGLHRQAALAAKLDDKSLNAWVVSCVEAKLEAPLKVKQRYTEAISQHIRQISRETHWVYELDLQAEPSPRGRLRDAETLMKQIPALAWKATRGVPRGRA